MTNTRAEKVPPRDLLLTAAESLMRQNGYAAVTSRRVAAAAGVKPQAIHYYFKTMDELYLMLFDRAADELIRRHDEVMTNDKPLRALWNVVTDPDRSSLMYEFVALSNHSPPIRKKIAEFGNMFRVKQIKIMEYILSRNDLTGFPWTPTFCAILLNCLARGLALQTDLGMTLGHEQALAVIDHYIGKFDLAYPQFEDQVLILKKENERLRQLLADALANSAPNPSLSQASSIMPA